MSHLSTLAGLSTQLPTNRDNVKSLYHSLKKVKYGW